MPDLLVQNRIELGKDHVLPGVSRMTGRATVGRCGRCTLDIRWRMVTEVKEAPAAVLRKPLAVLHHDVHAIEFVREVATAGWRVLRTVLVVTLQEQYQFLGDNRPVGKFTGSLIEGPSIGVNVYMMVFGETSFPVIQPVRGQRGADEHPFPITLRQ